MSRYSRHKTARPSRRTFARVVFALLLLLLCGVFIVEAGDEEGVLGSTWQRLRLWWDRDGSAAREVSAPSAESFPPPTEQPRAPGQEPMETGGERSAPGGVTELVDLAAASRDDGGEASATVRVGRVVEARSARGISGARVLATWFHAPASSLHAGTPPLRQELTSSDEDGSIHLPRHAGGDPRLLLQLQAEAPGFAPSSVTVEGVFAGHATARWLESDLELYPAACGTVRIVDEAGRPLGRVPLRVTESRDGYDFITRRGPHGGVALAPRSAPGPTEDSPVDRRRRRARLVEPLAPRILFTGEDGRLRLPEGIAPYRFELLEPSHFLLYTDPETGETQSGTVFAHVIYERETVIGARPGIPVRFQLVDLDGLAVADSEVELLLDGMYPLRLLTDESGRAELGVLPAGEDEPPLSPLHPRVGTLTVLAPELSGRRVEVAFPTLENAFVVPGRRHGAVRMRLVDADGEAARVPAVGFEPSLELVPVWTGEDGEVELVGPLPRAGATLPVHALGREPRLATFPESGGSDSRVDLGDVALTAALRREFRIAGGAAPGARLTVARADATAEERDEQLYPVPASGVIAVSGLRKGDYRVRLEEPSQPAWSGVVEISEGGGEVPGGIVLGEGEREAEPVLVRGRVVEAPASWLIHAQVVEQFLVAGESTPRAFPPYRLAPDGRFGSRRILPEVRSARIAIVGPETQGADVVLERAGERAVFDLGEVRLSPRPQAELHFHVEGLGRVTPPLQVALQGPDGLESSARFAVGGGALFIENLRPGAYRLRWRSAPDVEEAAGFEISSLRRQGLPIVIERRPLTEEILDLRVTDRSGVALSEARADPAARVPLDADYLFARAPGDVLVSVRPRGTTRFRLTAPGFLPASVEVPPGGVLPREVRLYRGARARGLLEDVDGRRFEGRLLVSWAPLTESVVKHGEFLEVDVQLGRFELDGLPPLPLQYRFESQESAGAAVRELALSEVDEVHDLGVLRLGEVRVVAGKVLRPDGLPAAGAEVALAARSDSYRFPLQQAFDLSRAEHYAHADGEGSFRFVGVATDLPEDVVLVARSSGFGDGVEDPFDRELDQHVLTLEDEAHLNIDVGYHDGEGHELYRFALSYTGNPSDPEAWVELGEVVPELFGIHRASGIEPGLYRLRWGLRDLYQPLPAIWEEVEVLPATESSISLRIRGDVLEGRAFLNRRLVTRGWVLLTDSPGVPSSTRVGRILGGRYVVVDPPRSLRVWAAVIPEEKPQPLQNLGRGEAVPVRLRGYRGLAHGRQVDIGYEAFHLTLEFSADFLARYPGARLYYDRPEWAVDGFQTSRADEVIEEPRVSFFLLEPGLRTISVRTARGSLLHNRVIDLRENLEVRVR